MKFDDFFQNTLLGVKGLKHHHKPVYASFDVFHLSLKAYHLTWYTCLLCNKTDILRFSKDSHYLFMPLSTALLKLNKEGQPKNNPTP